MAEVDFGRLDKSRKETGNVIVACDTCPGLFLLAYEVVQRATSPLVLSSPKYWKRHISKIHLLIPAQGPINIKNGSQVVVIPANLVPQVLGNIQYAFEQEGFQVILGAPTRFERADVI